MFENHRFVLNYCVAKLNKANPIKHAGCILLFLFGIFLYFLWLPGFVQAASFDCNKAVRPQDKLICSDVALSKLDEELDRTYKKVRVGLSEQAKKIVTDGQRSWLTYWPRDCSINGQGTKFGSRNEFDPSESLDCAKRNYESRINILRKGRISLWDEFQVYSVDHYKAVPVQQDEPRSEKESSSFVFNALRETSYPQIDLTDLRGEKLGFAKILNKWVFSKHKESMSEKNGCCDNKTDYHNRMVLVSLSNHLVGLHEHCFDYVHYTPHGLWDYSNYFFNKQKLKPVQTNDIFKGQQWIETLRQYSRKYIHKMGYEFLGSEIKDKDLVDLVKNPAQWWLTAEGLRIHFPLYTVTAYVDGMPSVIIPWRLLKPHLTDFAKSEIKSIKVQEVPE